jgi:hypothetical protein
VRTGSATFLRCRLRFIACKRAAAGDTPARIIMLRLQTRAPRSTIRDVITVDRDGHNIGCLFSFDIRDKRRYTRPVWDGQLVLKSLRGLPKIRHL